MALTGCCYQIYTGEIGLGLVIKNVQGSSE